MYKEGVILRQRGLSLGILIQEALGASKDLERRWAPTLSLTLSQGQHGPVSVSPCTSAPPCKGLTSAPHSLTKLLASHDTSPDLIFT